MRRILLKLSGESLGEKGFSQETAEKICHEIHSALTHDPIELMLLVGGGNIWRGRDANAFSFPQAASDIIGMMATNLNGMVIKEIFAKIGRAAEVYSPIPIPNIIRPHSISEELSTLAAGKVVIFAGGTGCPFFTTDTAAVLRALETQADAVYKGTKVAGIFSCDPIVDSTAELYTELTFDDAITKQLKVMDATAFALAGEHDIPIFVFDAFSPGGITTALKGSGKGTWVRKKKNH